MSEAFTSLGRKSFPSTRLPPAQDSVLKHFQLSLRDCALAVLGYCLLQNQTVLFVFGSADFSGQGLST
jgi:hypothetical protein